MELVILYGPPGVGTHTAPEAVAAAIHAALTPNA
jgi:replication-associated recombination protein RarA